MATTTWIGGSGDWNTASNWSNGVPTASDNAVFGGDSGLGDETITGGGAAASVDIRLDRLVYGLTLAGTYTVGAFVDDQVFVSLAPVAALLAGAATVTDGGQLTVQPGASFAPGTLTLDNGILLGSLGTLASPILLPALGVIDLVGTAASPAATLTGLISGPGTLRIGGVVGRVGFAGAVIPSSDVVLANPANSFSGGLVAEGARLELAAGTAGGSGPVLLAGTLVLDPGVVVGPITTTGLAEIDATDQTTTVFAAATGLLYENGAGHANIVGSIDPNAVAPGEEFGPPAFGSFTVQGGTGSVTVFGGNESGAFYGGSAGNNVIIAGLDVPGPRPISGYTDAQGRGFAIAAQPAPVTIVGGGSGDILVATGTDNGTGSNLIIAGAGNETLTGSDATASNVFFGGTGADVIAGGSGQSVIVAGSGPATLSGGAGTAAIFAGTGQEVILGGTGTAYVQLGGGAATLFAGTGMDLIGVVNGAGGSLVVSGFKVGTDRISAQGYASAPTVAAAGGNTVLGFSDHAQVTLLGVASLPASAYS